MKIAFVCRDVYYYNFPLIAKRLLDDYGVATYAIALSTVTASIIQDRYPGAFKKIYNLDEFFGLNDDFRAVSTENKIEYLKSVEKKLGIPSLYSLIYVDRVIVNRDYEDLIAIAYGIAKFIDEYMTGDFDLIIGELGTFFENMLMRFYSLRDTKYVTLTVARIKGKAFFTHGPLGEVLGLRESYEEVKKNGLTLEDEKRFEKFYDGFLRGAEKPDYTKPLNLPIKTMNIVEAYLERKRFRNKSRFVLESIDRSSISELVYLRLKKFINKSLFYRVRGVFSPLPRQKYIFFPLHLDPEIATLMYAPFYVNQLSMIENIAKSLPAEYVLAVKEHPAMYGMREYSFYRKVRRLPNVVLLEPSIDSYKVIQNAEAIVVLTGTAGLEGILLEKPVFVFGNVFYTLYDLIYCIENLKDLPAVFADGLPNFRKDRTALKEFIIAFLKCTYDAVIGNPIQDKRLLSQENISSIAEAIVSTFRAYVKKD